MINKFLYSVILVIIMLGCAHTNRINQKPMAKYYEQISQTANGKEGRIVLVNGETFKAGNIKIAIDSTSWINIGSWKKQTVSTQSVKEIVVKNPTKGAVEGCLIMSLAGGLYSVLFFALASGEALEGRSFDAMLITSLGIGAFTGSLAGMLITHKEKFILNNYTEPLQQKSNR